MSNADSSGPYPIPTPATGLQAAEFEQEDLGGISIACGDVVYTDYGTGLVLLRIICRNATEARKAMRAMRREARNVALKRAAFRVIPGSGLAIKAILPAPILPSAPPALANA